MFLPLVHFLSMVKFSQEKHIRPATFTSFLARGNRPFLRLEREILEDQPALPDACSLPSHTLNSLKLPLLMSRAVTLLFALFHSLRILTYNIS